MLGTDMPTFFPNCKKTPPIGNTKFQYIIPTIFILIFFFNQNYSNINLFKKNFKKNTSLRSVKPVYVTGKKKKFPSH